MNLKVELVKKKQPLRIMLRNTVLENDSRITKCKKDVVYLQLDREEELKEFKQGQDNDLENSMQNDEEYKSFLNPEIEEIKIQESTLEESTPLLQFIKNRKLKKELYKTPPKNVTKKKKNSSRRKL